jgi:hypothetical protein
MGGFLRARFAFASYGDCLLIFVALALVSGQFGHRTIFVAHI